MSPSDGIQERRRSSCAASIVETEVTKKFKSGDGSILEKTENQGGLAIKICRVCVSEIWFARMEVTSHNMVSRIESMQKDVTEGLQKFAEKVCEEFRHQQKHTQVHVADRAGHFQNALQHDIKTYLTSEMDRLRSETGDAKVMKLNEQVLPLQHQLQQQESWKRAVEKKFQDKDQQYQIRQGVVDKYLKL